MTKIIDRAGKGSDISAAENDANLSSLAGINAAITATSHTIDINDQNDTIEYSNASPIAVTLPSIASVTGANLHTDDFKVTLKNIGAGTVTVTRGSTDTFEDASTSIALLQYETVTIQTDSSLTKWNIISPSNLNGVTATVAELNTLDGITSTVAELNLLDGVTATTAEINTLIGNTLKTKVIDIGNWDMDATAGINLAHGIADYTKIRSIKVTIRNDADSIYYDFPSVLSAGTTVENASVDTTEIYLNRATSGFFDDTSFDTAAAYNRGWVILQYIV
jgi:hypothetical protein